MCEILARLESIAIFFPVQTRKPAVSSLVQQRACGQTQKGIYKASYKALVVVDGWAGLRGGGKLERGCLGFCLGECSSASPGVLAVKGTWLGTLQRPGVVVSHQDHGSFLEISPVRVRPVKPLPQPQGRADEPPWCFGTTRVGAPRSALQPGWHKW